MVGSSRSAVEHGVRDSTYCQIRAPLVPRLNGAGTPQRAVPAWQRCVKYQDAICFSL